jgi:hypothetical protein
MDYDVLEILLENHCSLHNLIFRVVLTKLFSVLGERITLKIHALGTNDKS